MAVITVAMRTEISQLYVSLFGRAPDSDGLGFWVSSYAGGNTIAKIAQSMYETTPARTYYPLYATPSEVVTTFYSNVLGRAPDAEGLAFWVNEFNNAATPGTFFAKLVSNVVNYSGTDADGLSSQSLFNNKVTVAQFYGENGGTIAGATSALSGVTAVASTVDTAKAAILNPAAAVVAGQTFTLTTSVDAVSGGAGDDTISGLLGTTPSFSVGDNIVGGAGTDTLNLIAAQHTANGMVSLDAVENVNVRLIGTAAETVELNAADWSGVAVLSNASSLSATTLEVSGVESTTNVTLYGNTDVSVQFASTTTANAVGTLVDAGTFAGATNIWASATANATAHLDFDLENTGLVSGVAVTLSGNNYARLEGGSNVEVYAVNGAGSAALVTDDVITSFDASGASANIDLTLQGASEVVVKGGSGNDTARFGTTLTNSDSFDGGAGNDTVHATVAVGSRSLNTTNVENAQITFSNDDGGTLSVTGTTVSTFTLLGAGDANIAGVTTGATINLTTGADALDAVSLDAASGAATMTINVGTASGNTTFSAISVTDVSNVVLNGLVGTGTNALGVLSFDSDVKNVTISTQNDADMTITNLQVAGATSISITSVGSASITMTSAMEDAAALNSLIVSADGSDSADITLDKIGDSATAASISLISLTANSGADIVTDTITLGTQVTGAGAATLTLHADGNGSRVGTTATDITASGAFVLTLDINAGASGSVVLGTIEMETGATAQTAAASGITLAVSDVSIGAAGLVQIEGISFASATGGAAFNAGNFSLLGSGASLILASAGIAATNIANVNVTIGTINLAADADATVGNIATTAGAVSSLTIVGADSASGRFGTIAASSVGAISVTLAGDAEADFGAINAASNIGAITLSLSNESDATLAAFTAGGDVGAITINAGASATANFADINASSVGAISISGAGFVDFGTVSAARVAGVDASQMSSGTFNIDISGVTNSVEVLLGNATNTVISGAGNEMITLIAGRTGFAGNDNIRFTTATQGTDYISNFIAGAAASGGDVIQLGTGMAGASGGFIIGSAIADDSTTLAVALATTASGAITIASGVSVVLINATAFASTAAMVSAVATAGSLEIKLETGGGGATAGSLVVVWTDGSDSYVSILGATAGASGANALIENGSAMSTIAILQGVTPGALVAANFDFV